MLEEKDKIKTHSDSLDSFSIDAPEKRLDQVKSLIQSTYHNLEKLSRVIDRIQQDQKKELYKKMPGIEGVFDGVHLISDDGVKHEVPANYAAKSRLVFGDRLKIVEEDGKKVFKQIQKPERKEVKGVLSKKEGKWYLLTDLGTYKISDTAAEFNRVELNEEAVGLIPENQLKAPFAALDRVIKKEIQVASVQQQVHHDEKVVGKEKPTKNLKPVTIKVLKKTVTEKPKEERREVKKPNETSVKKEEIKKEGPKEFVAGILEDDDLR